jgi:pimeloyl-ACP methyl ester carboxylesterase
MLDRRRVWFVVAAVALAAGLTGASADRASASGEAAAGDFAGTVTLPDGRRMYLECHGIGSPTVIFEAGLRARGDSWGYSAGGPGTGVFPRVTAFTRACIYDRPGTLFGNQEESRSDPVAMPRTAVAIVTDLHELLLTAGIPGPYVLVGASTGGLVARQYTSIYPFEVTGMVLVDAVSEAMEGLMKPGQFARYNLYYLQSASDQAARYADLESVDFFASFAEMRRKRRPPRRLPEVVISNDFGFGVAPGVTSGFAHLVNRAWKRSQAYLASLEPGIRHVDAVGSGHQIAINQPGFVARMVGRVVAAARRR